jgi:hypothetical protein
MRYTPVVFQIGTVPGWKHVTINVGVALWFKQSPWLLGLPPSDVSQESNAAAVGCNWWGQELKSILQGLPVPFNTSVCLYAQSEDTSLDSEAVKVYPVLGFHVEVLLLGSKPQICA